MISLFESIISERPEHLSDVAHWHGHIPFAFWCAQAVQPGTLVELGAHKGDSYFAFCQAVYKLGLAAACYAVDTWKGDEQTGFYGEEVYEKFKRYHDERYGAFSQLVRSTFDQAVEYFPDRSIDLLHLDGLHTYAAVQHDIQTWLPKLSSHAVVLLHGINVRERDFGVWRLWGELSQHYPNFSFTHNDGLGLLAVGENLRPAIQRLCNLNDEEAQQVRSLFARMGQTISVISERIALAGQAARLESRVAEQEQMLNQLQFTLQARETALAERDNELVTNRMTIDDKDGLIAALDMKCQIFASGLLDSVYYLSSYPDATVSRMDAANHYMQYGWKERYNPHPLFDTSFYLDQNRDVAQAKVNPLFHYLTEGWKQGRDPHPLFDTSFYVHHNPDIVQAGVNPFLHYVVYGWKQGRDPHPLFDTSFYLEQNPDVTQAGVNPLVHYVVYGYKEARHANPRYPADLEQTIGPAEQESGFLEQRVSSQAAREPVVTNPVIFMEQAVPRADVTISVVIPTQNAGEEFRRLLQALGNQQGFRGVEIVVVDSSSTDKTLELAEQCGAKTIKILPEEFSHSYAKNLGADASSGEYLLFTVQDALPPSPLWLYELFSAIQNNEVVAVSCAEFPRETADLLHRTMAWNHYRFLEVDKKDKMMRRAGEDHVALRKNGQLSDLACLIRKDVFLKYRYRTDYAENLDLGIRLINDAYKLAFLKSTNIIHSRNRPAYYYLKRGYTEYVFFSRVFPDYPILRKDFGSLLRDIVFTYQATRSIVDDNPWGLQFPSQTAHFANTFIKRFQTACKTTHEPAGQPVDQQLLDIEFQNFMSRMVHEQFPNSTSPDSNSCVPMLNFSSMILTYMRHTYELVDETVIKDFRSSLFKAFGYLCGQELAQSFITHGVKHQTLKDIHGELFKGV